MGECKKECESEDECECEGMGVDEDVDMQMDEARESKRSLQRGTGR